MQQKTEIFISYRRSDSEHVVERIYEDLVKLYGAGRVFKDTYSIPLGSNFPDYIQEKLSETKVLVLMIGKTFLTCKNEDGNNRIFDPNDYLRIEIATALKLGITIIPVLDKQVPYPKSEELPESIRSIVYCNALELAGASYFKEDMNRLTREINKIIGEKNKPGNFKTTGNNKLLLWVLLPVILVIVGLVYYFNYQKPAVPQNPIIQTDTATDKPLPSDSSRQPGENHSNDSTAPHKKNTDRNDPGVTVTTHQPADSLQPKENDPGNDIALNCELSGIEFIDAETFDDNLTFIKVNSKQYTYSGSIGHRFDNVNGYATLKGNQLFLSGFCTGNLTIQDCKALSGSIKAGPSAVNVKIVFKRK